MPISKRLGVSLFLALAFATTTVVAAESLRFKSWDDALKQGISAYKGGYYEMALPALEAAAKGAAKAGEPAETGLFEAEYHLARIYADTNGAYTDPVRAYRLFKRLADTLRNVDPSDEQLAPIAAKSLTEVSKVLRRGLAAADVEPNAAAADWALQSAATTFNNEDAQFELAKVLLSGEGPALVLGRDDDDVSRKVAHGRHWLSRLSSRGHAPAQAFFADLLWRGKYVDKDPVGALNLIDVAVANAPPEDRVWIEDIYQNIYCNAGEGVRRQANARVAEWRDLYGRTYRPRVEMNGLAELRARPTRMCADGEQVRPIDAGLLVSDPVPSAPTTPSLPATSPPTHAERTPGPPTQAPTFAPANAAPTLEPGFPMPSFRD